MCCEPNTLCFEIVKGLPAAFVALVIGCIAAYVAYQQYRVARAKLNQDLFDRRYEVFHVVWEYLSYVAQHGPPLPQGEQASAFANIIPKAEFLFGEDFTKYLRTVVEKTAQLRAINRRTDANGNVPMQDDIQPLADLTGWFHSQATTEAKKAFLPYLSFKDWRAAH